jgi:hypothetical protein
MDELLIKCTRMYMFNEMTDGILRQITLIEQALCRKLTDEDLEGLKELRMGLFYINPDEIVMVDEDGAKKVSFFTLEPEIQHDIFLNYGEGV